MASPKEKVLRKKFDAGSRRSWPLPPSSIFRCRPAKPWINPKLFQASWAVRSIPFQTGILIVGEVIPEEPSEDNGQFNLPDTSVEEPIYTDPVELTGVSDRVVEYSNRPERGIDVGNDYFLKDLVVVHDDDKGSLGQGNTYETSLLRELDQIDVGGKKARSKSKNPLGQLGKKRKWSPFQKDEKQSLKFLY